MSALKQQIGELVAAGDVRISEHGYDELAADGLTVEELLAGLAAAAVVEEYPQYPKGPTVLLLQRDRNGDPVHAVWGIPRGHTRPVVMVTAYRPDPDLWDSTFTKRLHR